MTPTYGFAPPGRLWGLVHRWGWKMWVVVVVVKGGYEMRKGDGRRMSYVSEKYIILHDPPSPPRSCNPLSSRYIPSTTHRSSSIVCPLSPSTYHLPFTIHHHPPSLSTIHHVPSTILKPSSCLFYYFSSTTTTFHHHCPPFFSPRIYLVQTHNPGVILDSPFISVLAPEQIHLPFIRMEPCDCRTLSYWVCTSKHQRLAVDLLLPKDGSSVWAQDNGVADAGLRPGHPTSAKRVV